MCIRDRFLGKSFDNTTKEFLRRVGKTQFQPSVAGQRTEVGGCWSTTSFEATEGTLFKVFGSERRSWRSVMKKASVFLAPRANAALMTIKMDTLQVAGKSQFNEVVLTGRFDILSPAEVKEQFGYSIPPHFEKFHDKERVNSLFDIDEKEPSKAPRAVIEAKTVTTEDGEKVVIKSRRRRGNIEV